KQRDDRQRAVGGRTQTADCCIGEPSAGRLGTRTAESKGRRVVTAAGSLQAKRAGARRFGCCEPNAAAENANAGGRAARDDACPRRNHRRVTPRNRRSSRTPGGYYERPFEGLRGTAAGARGCAKGSC